MSNTDEIVTDRPYLSPNGCPRCGFQYDATTGDSMPVQQIKNCDYCAGNSRRLVNGEKVLPNPLKEFRIWKPS